MKSTCPGKAGRCQKETQAFADTMENRIQTFPGQTSKTFDHVLILLDTSCLIGPPLRECVPTPDQPQPTDGVTVNTNRLHTVLPPGLGFEQSRGS
ncbi:hypothetical protein FQN60_009659 [Etheostoma spectabile]|uniref:Uncharacterized protein n=1 Tax=Etheostoma spectabile TaxID=54343 RepID=A0A5J5DJS3_9PERO|nr:hypothetical protein FQN60_009659 [Etheostoma spectabile]